MEFTQEYSLNDSFFHLSFEGHFRKEKIRWNYIRYELLLWYEARDDYTVQRYLSAYLRTYQW